MHQYPPKIVSSHSMEVVMWHGDIEWEIECYISDREPLDHLQQYPYDIQVLLHKHQKVFYHIPPRVPLDRGFEHIIELKEGVQVVITNPYHHPKMYKYEIEKTIKNLLKMGHIRPSSRPLSPLVVLVKKKDGSLRMCIDYRVLNNKTIKNRYPIPRIDELMDELRGEKYFMNIVMASMLGLPYDAIMGIMSS
jgi:hypothetical protein